MKNSITQSIKNSINYLARKYSCGDKWKFDEITQELYMSVLKSDENFREGTGACFQTYAIGNIKFSMFLFLHNQTKPIKKKQITKKNKALKILLKAATLTPTQIILIFPKFFNLKQQKYFI